MIGATANLRVRADNNKSVLQIPITVSVDSLLELNAAIEKLKVDAKTVFAAAFLGVAMQATMEIPTEQAPSDANCTYTG